MNKRSILFIHQSFPGQFGNLAKSLAQEGYPVFALTMNPHARTPGVTICRYRPLRAQNTEVLPYLLRELDAKILRGESAFRAMRELKHSGLNPDVVCVHPGWGEALFIKEVWPKARLVVYGEWFYNPEGQEVNFDKEFPCLTEEETLRLRLKNMSFLYALNEADAVFSPTQWQKSRFPAWAQRKISVIHDGLDISGILRASPRSLRLPARDVALRHGMPIVTYVAQHLEPVRGFHIFMRSLPYILEAHPDAHIIVMGRDAGAGSGYGGQNTTGVTWRQALQEELEGRVDYQRVHFLGKIPRSTYLSMLCLSACHVYLTTPFILSWSFLEAATMGLPIVASSTPPVMEFSRLRGVDLVDFGQPLYLAEKVIDTLNREAVRTPNSAMLEELNMNNTLPQLKRLLLPDYTPTSQA